MLRIIIILIDDLAYLHRKGPSAHSVFGSNLVHPAEVQLDELDFVRVGQRTARQQKRRVELRVHLEGDVISGVNQVTVYLARREESIYC